MTETCSHPAGVSPTDPALKTILDTAPVGILVFDQEAHVIAANALAENGFGIAFDRSHKQKCGDFIACADHHPNATGCPRCPLYRAVQAALEGATDPAVVEGEVRMQREGSHPPVWLKFKTRRIVLDDRALAVMAMDDITEHRRAQESLLDSQERYRSLIEQINEALVVVQDGVVKFVNSKALVSFGYSEQDIFSTSIFDWVHPEDRHAVVERYHKKIGGDRSPTRHSCRAITREGQTRWFEISSVMIQWEARPATLNLISDITERRQVEEDLRISEERLRLAHKVANDVVWDWDIAGGFQRWNDAGKNAFGWESSKIGHQSVDWWLAHIHPADRQRVEGSFFGVLEDAAVDHWQEEYRFQRADGTYAIVLDQGYIMRNAAGEAVRMIGAVRDMTDIYHALQATKESEERFHKAFMASPAPLVISEIESGRFLDVNDRWVQMLGFSREEQIGRTSKEVGIWADPGERDRIVQLLTTHGAFKDQPIVFKSKSGQTIHALWSAESVSLGGRPVMLSMIFDETERKAAEQEQEKLRNQLHQSQKLESLGRLAGGVAHDFNNMLAVILGRAEIAMDRLDPLHPVSGDLAEIKKAAEHSANITRQLLGFARKQTVAPKVLDLNETVEGMLKVLRRLIGENINLAWLPGKGLGRIKMDPSQIGQVLANLCANARDAIQDTGTVTIKTGAATLDEAHSAMQKGVAPGDYLLLVVNDDGIGMDKTTLDNVFEPFFTTKKVGKGTGLGLATVYGIVKQNNGLINLHSTPGKGTTVCIYLPHHREPVASTANAAAPDAPAPRGKETVLLVEDEPMILEVAKIMLEKHGYTVLAAALPKAALCLAAAHPGRIDLLITDVIMPEMNGWDLADKLLTRHPGIKTLFMSGYTANAITHRGRMDKQMNFIQKPFPLKDLAIKAREVLDTTDTRPA